jgi:hypothetical protein
MLILIEKCLRNRVNDKFEWNQRDLEVNPKWNLTYSPSRDDSA